MVAITDATGVRFEANTVADVMELLRLYRMTLPTIATPMGRWDKLVEATRSVPLSNTHLCGPLKSPLPAPPTGPAQHGFGIGCDTESVRHSE